MQAHPAIPTTWRRSPLYGATRVPPSSPWAQADPAQRSRRVWWAWAATWLALAAGYWQPLAWQLLVPATAVHAAVVLWSVGGSALVFPAQLRLAYTLWLVLGVFVPGLTPMMHITMVGGTALLALGYCPLARMLYLLPFNRPHRLTPRALLRTFIAAPRPGRFVLRADET